MLVAKYSISNKQKYILQKVSVYRNAAEQENEKREDHVCMLWETESDGYSDRTQTNNCRKMFYRHVSHNIKYTYYK